MCGYSSCAVWASGLRFEGWNVRCEVRGFVGFSARELEFSGEGIEFEGLGVIEV